MPGPDEWLSPARVQKPAYSPRLPASSINKKPAGLSPGRLLTSITRLKTTSGSPSPGSAVAGAGIRPGTFGRSAPPGMNQISTRRNCARASVAALAGAFLDGIVGERHRRIGLIGSGDMPPGRG